MPALRLLAKLVLYYLLIAASVGVVLWLFPAIAGYLPVGRVQALLTQGGGVLKKGEAGLQIQHIGSLGASLVWLTSALLGALLTSLPVSWIYMKVRNHEQYDQSLVDTIIVLPMVVTSIVVIVQDSLALSFSLAGIAGAARFRNSMKSSGDLLFILLAVGIGLAAGIGAMELAFVTTIAFNLCFVALWATEYGERKDMKRFLSDFEEDAPEAASPSVVVTTLSTTVVTEEPGGDVLVQPNGRQDQPS